MTRAVQGWGLMYPILTDGFLAEMWSRQACPEALSMTWPRRSWPSAQAATRKNWSKLAVAQHIRALTSSWRSQARRIWLYGR